MYFDIHYIRKFLGYTINILLIGGAIILGIGVILTFIVQMEDDSKYQAVRIVNGLKYMNNTIFVCGLALVFCGLIGYMTTKINNDITVGLFACTSFIIFISILIFTMGFVGLIYVHSITKGTQHACIKSEFFKTSERIFNKASRYYGSSKCKTNIQDLYQFRRDPQFAELALQNDPNNGYSSVFNCPHYDDMLDDLGIDKFDETPSYIGSLEITFQCGGVCHPHPVYVFSDINRGPPIYQKGCYEAVVDYVDKISVPGVVVLWFITCLLLMVVINSICLFFHPKRYDDLYIYQAVGHSDHEEEDRHQENSYEQDVSFNNKAQKKTLSRQLTSDAAADQHSQLMKKRQETEEDDSIFNSSQNAVQNRKV